MRKATLFRLSCLALLAVLASFGTFTVTATPAYALQCAPTFGTCTFSYIRETSNSICCVYLCPNGSERTGVCEQI